MKLTCDSCSGSQNQWNITRKSFPALKNCAQRARKTKLRCRENIWRNSWKFNLKKKNLKMFSYSPVKTKLNVSGSKCIWYCFIQLKTVEQEVVRSQSFTVLENRTLTSRMRFHIQCISFSMLMPPGRQPVKAVFFTSRSSVRSNLCPL